MPTTKTASILKGEETRLLDSWMEQLLAAGAVRSGQIKEAELRRQTSTFLRAILDVLQSAAPHDDVGVSAWSEVRGILDDVSQSRAHQGFSPREMAIFVFSLKAPIFALLREKIGHDVQQLVAEIMAVDKVLDMLGVYTMEMYQKSRDAIIERQQQELLELSTPVVQLWNKILALPLIGTLDSNRTQFVMESLLDGIVRTEAEIAIIDITGVPTVDTAVAQHLIKTVSAARLMGADCIISGIRPQIAQTIVNLGLQLNVVSKATMADALALALRRTGQAVTTLTGNGA